MSEHINESQKELEQQSPKTLQKKEKSTGKSSAAVSPFGGKSLGEEYGGSITPPNGFGTFQLKANDTFPLSRPAVPFFKNNDKTSETPVQKKENNTGLPDNLKSGIENLSGFSMNDVKVHYNSDKPAQLQAHAYAQGTDIHLAAGQEKHLPHEAWHVVQQKQGRVKPTLQMKGKVNVNDDKGLEREADVMGAKALQMKEHNKSVQKKEKKHSEIVQKNSKTASKDITLTIAADKEAEYWDKRYYEEYNVGHSWIMIERADKSKDSYGFWPSTGFSSSEPWKTVEGKVKHPDTSHNPTATYSKKITQEDLAKGEQYAVDNAKTKYNLFTYNCTSFARQFFKKCGQSAPSAGLFVEDPNGLHSSIASINSWKGLTPTEEPKSKAKK